MAAVTVMVSSKNLKFNQMLNNCAFKIVRQAIITNSRIKRRVVPVAFNFCVISRIIIVVNLNTGESDESVSKTNE